MSVAICPSFTQGSQLLFMPLLIVSSRFNWVRPTAPEAPAKTTSVRKASVSLRLSGSCLNLRIMGSSSPMCLVFGKRVSVWNRAHRAHECGDMISGDGALIASWGRGRRADGVAGAGREADGEDRRLRDAGAGRSGRVDAHRSSGQRDRIGAHVGAAGAAAGVGGS